jgi:hypothetical protein
LDKNQELKLKLMVWMKNKSLNESSWFGEPKCKLGYKVAHFFIFLGFFFIVFFPPCCSNLMKMENMLSIEDIVKSIPIPPFLTNSRIDMVGFVDPHKVVAKQSMHSFLFISFELIWYLLLNLEF